MNLAQKINGEIISADSRQVYRGFDIATAKITKEEMNGIKHYLIDVLEPCEDFSAGIFVDMAKDAINTIIKKGKTPIIAGGTGLYLKMLDGVNMPKGEPDKKLREELQKQLEEKGSKFLYNRLCSLDATFAEKIHVNDTYKIMRSIEILEQAQTTMQEARGKKEKEYNILKIVLAAKDREIIYNRINARVDLMIAQGLEQEARFFYEKEPELKSFNNTIGYQEFIPYFNGEYSLSEAIEKIKQNTRRYAKRQLTWFRAQEDVNWFYIDELAPQQIEAQVLNLYNNF